MQNLIDNLDGIQSTQRYVDKKHKAIEAAAKVFAEKGFHGATTEDIANELNIKQGSLYYYFASKEQALQDVCEYDFAKYVKRMKNIAANKQPFEAKMLAIIASHLTNYSQKNNAMKVHNEQRLHLSLERRVLLKELGSSYRQLLEQILLEGKQQGFVRDDIDTHFVAYSIIGMCNAWGANLYRDNSLDVFEVVQQCAEMILYGTLQHS